MTYLFVALAFGAGFLLVFGINWMLNDIFEERKRRVRERLEEDFRLLQKERARGSLDHKDLYELAAEGYVDVAKQQSLRERFIGMIEQAGLQASPGTLAAYSILTAVALGGVCWFATGNWPAVVLISVFGGFIPFGYLHYLRAKRHEQLLSQLPDAFELMSRVLKAGQTISQAIQGVADEFSRPIADEFAYCYEQQNLGLSPEAAMRDLSRRTGLLEIKVFVLAVTVHRQTGGNLSELLEKISTVIRQRYRIRGQIKALTAEGRLQAIILLALPPMMLLYMLVVNPDYAMTLFDFPLMLVALFGAEVIGALWMRRIVSFDF